MRSCRQHLFSISVYYILFFLLFFGAYSCINAMQPEQVSVDHQSLHSLLIFNGSDQNHGDDLDGFSQLLHQALSEKVCSIIVKKSTITSMLKSLHLSANNSGVLMMRLNKMEELLSGWYVFDTQKGDYCILVHDARENNSRLWVTLRAREELGLLVREESYLGPLGDRTFKQTDACDDAAASIDVVETYIDASKVHGWNIFLMGHGTSSTIAAFSNNNFRRFLLALNLKNVSSLLYLTCSGAGKHLIEPYTEENGQSPIRLNYAIACQSLCSSGSVVAIMNFAQLFRELANKRENQTWDECFQAALRESDRYMSSYDEYNSTSPKYLLFPWIREPNADKFHLLTLPLYHAQPYLTANPAGQEEIILTRQNSTLLINSPYVNRLVVSHAFPTIISAMDRPYHYFKCIAIPSFYLHDFATKLFDYPFEIEGMTADYLIGTVMCAANGRIANGTNMRIQIKPMGLWPRLIHYLKYGINSLPPESSKIVTVKQENTTTIRAVLNQKRCYDLNWKNIYKYSAIVLGLFSSAMVCHSIAQSNSLNHSFVAMAKIAEKGFCGASALVPLYAWLTSKHIDNSTAPLMWQWQMRRGLDPWEILSNADAQNYYDEFHRQRDELVHLAARQ